MRIPILLTLATLMSLGACSPGEKEQNAQADNDMILEDNMAQVPEAPANGIANGAADRADAPPAIAQDSATAIPPALRGRWGMVPKDCTSLHGDAKGLLEISATDLTFYESRGTLKALTEREPTRIKGRFTFNGEGMTWQSTITLTVQDNGQTLIRQEDPDDGPPGTYRYARCKA
ncbi:hypothetical protein OOT33_03330 [Sphingobium sp. DEHP117]|uniref:hypothetical protein n=1 Tax=Sphingobium sp. DEHP117 TaxID=2993436 RepID=UPI0027D5AEA0|nr:hypothetical protein [Sphingobium sp. DEHP117]MDQ4419470.1 hypothetical protein [Sphingobium sp. DEHP117]